MQTTRTGKGVAARSGLGGSLGTLNSVRQTAQKNITVPAIENDLGLNRLRCVRRPAKLLFHMDVEPAEKLRCSGLPAEGEEPVSAVQVYLHGGTHTIGRLICVALQRRPAVVFAAYAMEPLADPRGVVLRVETSPDTSAAEEVLAVSAALRAQLAAFERKLRAVAPPSRED